MVNSSEHGLARVVHHKDYYLRGGDMTVLVENHLYRIHSHFFERESLFFRQKFQSAEGEELGSSDNNAYTLDDVKSEDFSRFLWVFYNPKYSLYDAPLETWLSILHLANRWGFGNVKELTVRELEKMEIEPVEKIAIYHEYTINKLFLISSYIAVCKREKPLSFAEGMRLGMETVLRIADARERARQRAAESGIRTPTFDDFEDNEMESMIREVFGIMSRPTSPTPQTSPSYSYSNGSTHTSNTKVNGSTAQSNGSTYTGSTKVNGSTAPSNGSAYTGSTKVNGSTAPSNGSAYTGSAKVNGSTAPKVNGGSSTRTTAPSVPDSTTRSSVDIMPTFSTAMETQPTSTSSSNSTSTPTSNGAPKPPTLAPETKPVPPEKPSALLPEQMDTTITKTPTDASKASPASPWSKANGTGEPSLEETKESWAGSPDSSTTVVTPTAEPVVSTPVVKNTDENEPNDHENDAEKDEIQAKDPELSGVMTDSEGGGRGGRGGKGGQKRNNAGRGAGNKNKKT